MNKQSCRFLCTTSHGKNHSLIHVPCSSPAQFNGYCTAHRYAARLREKARHYGCPEIMPPVNPKTKEREGLIIGQGLPNWQTYCDVVSLGRAEVMMKRLDEEHGQMFKRGVA